jgi:hypothetical protein
LLLLGFESHRTSSRLFNLRWRQLAFGDSAVGQ